MNKKVIIIIFVLILIIIGASTAVYFFINKPSTDEKESIEEEPKEEEKVDEQQEEVDEESPIDAKCRGEIEDSFYQFEDTPIIGSDILDNIKGFVSQFIRTIKQHIFKERFALASTFITNKKLLDRNKTYYVGRRKVSNLISGPMYGGVNNCSEYPDLVYKEKITLIGKNNWNLVKSDFYGPYGGDWSDSNVKTKPYTLEQAQSYAESRGYDGITYNGNGQETGNQFFMWKSSSSDINNGGYSLGWDVYKLDINLPASKCTGYDCTIEGQKCLPGTEGASGKTWVCTNKKWVEAPTVNTTDPCSSYSDNSTNISQACYNKIWKDAGCITPPATMGDWHKSQSKAGLISDSNAWATMSDDGHRNGCYTTDRSKWPESKLMYGPWIAPEQKAQAIKPLLTEEKVYMLYSLDGYTKMVTESGVAKYYVGGMEKFKASDWDSYTNANGNYKLKDTPQPKNCTVSDWSGWSSCNQNAERTRTRSIITPESNGGVCPERNDLSETVRDVNACPIEVDQSSCRYNVSYYSENWEACYKKGWTLDPSLWRYFDE